MKLLIALSIAFPLTGLIAQTEKTDIEEEKISICHLDEDDSEVQLTNLETQEEMKAAFQEVSELCKVEKINFSNFALQQVRYFFIKRRYADTRHGGVPGVVAFVTCIVSGTSYECLERERSYSRW